MPERTEALNIKLEINENEEDYVVTYEVNYNFDEDLCFLHFKDERETKTINFSGTTLINELRELHEENSELLCQDTLKDELNELQDYLEFPVSSDIVKKLEEKNFEWEKTHYFKENWSLGYYYEINVPSKSFTMLAATDRMLTSVGYTAKFHGVHLRDVPETMEAFNKFIYSEIEEF